MNTFVYFAQGGPFLKIGFSNHPEKRISVLGYRWGYGLGRLLHRPKDTGPLSLISTIPGGRTLESLTHKLFRAFQIEGEWFDANSQSLSLVSHLSSIAKDLAGGGDIKEGMLIDEWNRVFWADSASLTR